MSEQNNRENINTWLSEINVESKTAVSVDCVIFGYNDLELSVLQIECNMPPYEGMMSLLGDIVKNNETLDQAANRILFEISGLNNIYLEQVHSFSAPDRHPLGRVISVAYYALVKTDTIALEDKANKDLKWIPIRKIDEMAFDHRKILDICLDSLKRTIRNRPIGFNLLPKKFTLIQLQRLYEVILEIELDKRNFRRKLQATDLLIDLGETQSQVSHRPAKLYSFDFDKYELLRKEKGLKFDL